VFEYLGYSTDINGQTTISFVVTNKCKYDVGYVAIGTDGFIRIGPANGSVYRGSQGNYTVSWTRATGNPGFVSVKFESGSNSFHGGASDVFSIVVRNFNPNTTIQVQGKAKDGSMEETFSFLLTQTSCPPPSSASFLEWLRGSWNKLLVWLASPEAVVPTKGITVGTTSPSWNGPTGADIDFAPAINCSPAISRDGTLNWRWATEAAKSAGSSSDMSR
jgi:hypothetical protein